MRKKLRRPSKTEMATAVPSETPAGSSCNTDTGNLVGHVQTTADAKAMPIWTAEFVSAGQIDRQARMRLNGMAEATYLLSTKKMLVQLHKALMPFMV